MYLLSMYILNPLYKIFWVAEPLPEYSTVIVFETDSIRNLALLPVPQTE